MNKSYDISKLLEEIKEKDAIISQLRNEINVIKNNYEAEIEEYNNIWHSYMQSEYMMHIIEENGRIGSWELDLLTLDIHWTKQVYSIFEIDSNLKPNLDILISCLSPNSKIEFNSLLESTNMLKTNNSLELNIISGNGNCLNLISKFQYDNELNKLFGTFQDITEQVKSDLAIKEASQYARNLIETSLDSLVTISAEGKITDVNKATESITGVQRSELIGSDFANYFTNPELAKKGYLKVLNEGQVKDYPLEIRHKNGDLFSVLYNASLYKDNNGVSLGVFAAARDVTESKKAEIRLKGFSDILENSLNEIYIIDIETFNFLYANKGGLLNLGYNIDELKQLNPINIKQDFDYKDFKSLIEPILNGSEDIIKFEAIHQRKNKSIYNAEVHLQISFFEGKKSITQIVLDITQRKNIEIVLRDSEEKLSSLFSTMTEIVVMHELIFDDKNRAIDYRILDCNIAFLKLVGKEKKEVIGKLATELYQLSDAPYLEQYSKVATTRESLKFDQFYQPLSMYFSISVVSPKLNHFATITADITDLRKTQDEIVEKNKELENYLYVASHDLRSPLVNVQGFSQRLLKKTNAINNLISGLQIDDVIKKNLSKITDEDIPKTLDFIFSSVNKMETLLNGLLQVSRTGRIQLNIQLLDMNKILHSIISSNKFQIYENEVEINLKKLPACYGDEALINQVFTNIVSNSIKYKDVTKPLVIEINGQILFNKVIYKIEDNGIGIAERHIEKIWDIFYRVDSSSKVQGEGLGLSIVKRILDKHKGRIWVESLENKGTSFFIELNLHNVYS